jgi:chemotaxis protein histidine kinase CheA
VVDGRVHHIIVSVEKISAPRLVPHTIEVPVLNEETFAKRLAGETGTRPALSAETIATMSAAATEVGSGEHPVIVIQPLKESLGPLDVTADSVPSLPKLPLPASTAPEPPAAVTTEVFALSLPPLVTPSAEPPAPVPTAVGSPEITQSLSTTLSATDVAVTEAAPAAPQSAPLPDPASIIDPPDPRLSEVLKEVMHVDANRLESFLGDAREKAGQLRAIIKLPARDPQAFREKLVLILELIRGIHARAQRLPLPSVCERAERFETSLGQLRDKPTLSGNDFLPIAVKLDDLLSHLAIQGEVVTRLRDWRIQNGISGPPDTDVTQRSATMTGTTIRQPKLRSASSDGTTQAGVVSETQKAKRLSDLSQESLEEMAQFLADMYSKRIALVCVGLEDVPQHYRRTVEKILGQLIHNAVRHGVETPADRVVQDKPESGTVAVQFLRVGADGYQLSVQDDGRGLDHEKIRAEAIRQGVLKAEVAEKLDPRKLAGLIFRPGFTTMGEAGARGIGMDVVRDLVHKAGGRVGIATKPGEYTRFRITLPHEKKAADAAVA